MVLVPRAEAAQATQLLAERMAGEHALVADVSDARAHFTLEGESLREVLAKLAPGDMAPEAFPVGELRRTRLAQVSAAFWLREPAHAQVFCFRSVAGYVFDLLTVAADPASEVGHFA
jgi:sarcosine oxidase subunit gamma